MNNFVKFTLGLFILLYRRCHSDDLFFEGFFNHKVLFDSRKNISNPLTTNTNRYSDGFSSSSSFDSVSPHFPFYNGATTNTSNRYLHFVKYRESAEEQGIGFFLIVHCT
jgi:hypothetical protein